MLALGLLTITCLRFHLNLTTASLLYVVVVAVLARLGGFVPSVIASIIAAVLLAYSTPPAYSFRIDDPLDVVAVSAFLIVSVLIAQLVTRARRMAEEALSSVNRKLVDAEDRVREQIGRDLDNDIAQRLALVCIKLALVSNELSDQGGNALNSIKALRKQTSDIATDVMALSERLRSYNIEYLGIETVVERFCTEFGEQHNAEIDFRSHDVPSPLPLNVSISLFRVLQEALENSVKYSGVRRYEVELFGASQAIHLKVHDSGIGFDPKVTTDGLGLVSVQERVKLVKGKMSIESQPNMGTTIHACVPLQDQRAKELNAPSLLSARNHFSA
jgi:signal transduction histidine kinase